MAEVSLFDGLEFPDRIPVKADREVLYFVDPEGAKRLAKKGLVRIVGTRSKVRALEVIARTEKAAAGTVAAMAGEALATPAYSHNHEVSETYLDEQGNLKRRHPLDANPEKVWTLRRIPEDQADLFCTAVTDCIVRPKAKVIEFKRPEKAAIPHKKAA